MEQTPSGDGELWARLRGAGEGPPSREGWNEIQACLEAWPADATRDGAVTWAKHALAAWPDRGYEAVTGAALRAHRQTGAPLPPWWPLVRHVTLFGGQPIAPVEALAHVTTLWAMGGDIDLSPLLALPNLRALDLSRNEGVLKMPSLASLTQLEKLTITQIPYVLDLDALAGLPRLADLCLAGNPNLTDLSPLQTLPALSKLNVSGCNSLADLRPLAAIASLRELDIGGNERLTDIAPLAALGGLRWLRVTGSDRIGGMDAVLQAHPQLTLVR